MSSKEIHKEFKTVQKSLRIRESLMQKIEEMAINENRNFNNMVETLLLKSINM